jgi:tetratricopeptide (TPR) repeat protein
MPRAAPKIEPVPALPLRLLDGLVVVAFLGLAFLLGAFPLNDTDFWWHLRTGDLIRRTGEVPRVDPYLFGGAPNKAWIDLHWGFEVLVSLGYRAGGVVLLNLAKCAITTLAVFLLLSAKRREWPAWAMVLGWLPALLVLGGRMYVRPETLTLLYLAGFLAILFRWKRMRWLALGLPVIQVLWVNTQGLFVLGPVVLAMALIDAAIEPGAFAKERRPWWRVALAATGLTGLACVVNPYGLAGTLFPIELLGTMGNRAFETIAELTPLPAFIREVGFRNLPLQLHLATMLVGASSFLVPLSWQAWVRLRDPGSAPPEPARGRKKGRAARSGDGTPARRAWWVLSPFRLMLFAAFSVLSWKATRNSHQFAAVVGTVTGWNFGEWAWALRARRMASGETPSPRASASRRSAVLVAVAILGFAVGSGLYYEVQGEGRTVGLGEKSLWFPHEGARFAGREGMPDRFQCFHNGLAGVFVYHNGPRQKVFADARLEVVGPTLFQEFTALEQQIADDRTGWRAVLHAQGDPGVFVDLIQAQTNSLAATLLADSGHACVYLDAMAAVFVPSGNPHASERVDFVSRHFAPSPQSDPKGADALAATAKALRSLTAVLLDRGRVGVAKPLLLLGHGYAHRALRIEPRQADAWKQLGLIEVGRNPLPPNALAGRASKPFDPIFDLSTVRATHDLRRADELRGDDFTTILGLVQLYQARGMIEPSLPLLERLAALPPANAIQRGVQERTSAEVARLRAALGSPPAGGWKNAGELERAVALAIDRGHVAWAADRLESAYAPRERSWELADRLATIRLHLGEPSRARLIWESAATVPRPALRAARVAATHLVEEDYDAARRAYAEALAIEPDLFEAHYGLAVLEADAGRREAAIGAARAAVEHAPTEVAAAAAREVLASAEGPVGR